MFVGDEEKTGWSRTEYIQQKFVFSALRTLRSPVPASSMRTSRWPL